MALTFLIDWLTGQLVLVMNTAGASPITDSHLLMEASTFLLLEDGSKIILE
jgi:hypothetical protein